MGTHDEASTIIIGCPQYGYQVFEMIMHGLKHVLEHELHYPVDVRTFENGVCTLHDRWIILFGVQHMTNVDETCKTNRVIIYNLEQLVWGKWDSLIAKYQGAYTVWDYSRKNIAYVQENFSEFPPHRYVPLGYSDYFRDVCPTTTESDRRGTIAFLGNLSPRRSAILDRIRSAGVHSSVYDRHYFQQVREVMASHGTLLNLHFHPQPCILEVVRILPWICQGKRVITERSADKELDDVYETVVDFIDSDEHGDAITADVMRHVLEKPASITLGSGLATFRETYKWSNVLTTAMGHIRFHDLIRPPRVAIGTLHCNDRRAIFHVIESLAKCVPETSRVLFTWVVFSQGCSSEHNDEIEHRMLAHGFQLRLLRIDANLGWSRGMNGLYTELYMRSQYELVLHLEDDWICDAETTTDPNWLEDCLVYMAFHQNVSTLFLRKYVDDQDKFMYGWTRSIPYLCFEHPNSFNYQSKIQSQPKIPFRGLTLRRIPEFLYSANPTIIRVKDYVDAKVLPFPEFDDATCRQGEWKTTTSEDAPQWGYSEGLSMEKIRHLVCMNVNHGFFYHRN